MDLPAIVRSSHTWDTSGPGDLRQGEEAIVVSARDLVEGGVFEVEYSEWVLIPLEKPRLITLKIPKPIDTVLKRWLKPA